MIIKAARIIPGDEDDRISTVKTIHDGVDHRGCKILALEKRVWRMIALRAAGRGDPCYISHLASFHIPDKLIGIANDVFRVTSRLNKPGTIPERRIVVIVPADPRVV